MMLNPEFHEFHFHGGHTRKKKLEDVTLEMQAAPWQVTLDGCEIYITKEEIDALLKRCNTYGIYHNMKFDAKSATLTFKEREDNE